MLYFTAAELKAHLKASKPSKYHNVATVSDGLQFDSKKEARRYQKLALAQAGGLISELEVHPVYRITVEAIGREVFRYTPDFRYKDEHGNVVVEDVKSAPTKTEAYGIRKRLMRAIYGIRVVEV